MIQVMKLAAALAGIAGGVSVGLASWGAIRGSGVSATPVTDTLIIAPHPDDEVIMAAEYGVEAAGNGKRVEILYVTRGARRDDDTRAATRRKESEAAWALAGVDASALTFLDLPSTDDVYEAIPWTPEELETARRGVAASLSRATPGSAVIIPAAAEAHVEHRLTRRLVVEEWSKSGRTDLNVLESPTYNDLHSLVQSPARSLRYVLSELPGVRRLWTSRPVNRAGFASGPPATPLPADPARLETKRRMLQCFESENPALLLHFFGYPDRQRPVSCAGRALREQPERGYVRIGKQYLGPSVLLLVSAIAGAAFSAGAWLTRFAHVLPFPRPLLVGVAAVLSAASLVRLGLRRASLIQTLWIVAGALGIAVGAFQL